MKGIMMARRAFKTTDFAAQLALWVEPVAAVDNLEAAVTEPDAASPQPSSQPSPHQGESAKAPPTRAVAARRMDSIARSERALAAIRALLSEPPR